ncbi:MAG: hypothetical protein ACPG40_10910 [Alphaproteobacteria bacterium]
MYLTLNAPDLARPLYRAMAPHLSQPLERHWRLPSRRQAEPMPAEVWLRIEAMEIEERRQKRQHALSPLELEAIRSLRTRQWFGLLDLFKRKSVEAVLVWNGYRGRRGLLVEAAKYRDIPVVFFERCAYPGFVQVDRDGVNAGARHLNSGNWVDQNADEAIGRWFRASQRQRRGANPFAPATSPAENLPKRFLYCPLQVAADTQLSVFGGWISDMPDFLVNLVKASEALPPDMKLVFRPHPSCRVGQESALHLALTNPQVRVIDGGTSAELLQKCEGVVTVNSSVGLEAFAYDKPVITLGESFYDGPGLTEQAADLDALKLLFKRVDRLSFEPEQRMKFLTWLREVGFKRWPRHARDPAAKSLADYVEALIRS